MELVLDNMNNKFTTGDIIEKFGLEDKSIAYDLVRHMINKRVIKEIKGVKIHRYKVYGMIINETTE